MVSPSFGCSKVWNELKDCILLTSEATNDAEINLSFNMTSSFPHSPCSACEFGSIVKPKVRICVGAIQQMPTTHTNSKYQVCIGILKYFASKVSLFSISCTLW